MVDLGSPRRRDIPPIAPSTRPLSRYRNPVPSQGTDLSTSISSLYSRNPHTAGTRTSLVRRLFHPTGSRRGGLRCELPAASSSSDTQ